MRLLFINRFFHPDRSATASLLTELVEELAQQGFSITVVTGRVGYLQEEPLGPPKDCYKGVMVKRVWSTRFGRGSTIGRLADYVTFYLSAGCAIATCPEIDCLVVLSDPPMLSVLAAVCARLKRWKTVCWLQDVFPENAVRAGILRNGWLARSLRRVSYWSLSLSDGVIIVGRCMLRQLLPAGIPRQRIAFIPNWADGERLTPVAENDNWFRKTHGLVGPVVMYAGNLGMVHDAGSLGLVIRALQGMPDVHFVFMGFGPGKDRLEQWARDEGMTNLRFIDYQAQQHLRYGLSAGDIHLVSLRNDMAGLSVPSKVYGIMAVARPVIFIGPAESEVATMIREAGCGEVFDPAESEKAALAIVDLIREPERREHLGKAGRRYFDAVLEKKLAMNRFQAILHRSDLQPVKQLPSPLIESR